MSTTDVFVVLDKSGSMSGSKFETALKMVYEMAEVLARAEKTTGQTYNVTVIPFGSYVVPGSTRTARQIIDDWTSVKYSINSASTGNSTALRDAIGLALERVQKSYAQAKLVSIFTDGEENCSYQYGAPRLKALLAQLEAKGDLTVTMAGPASAKQMLDLIGIPADNFRPWDGSEAELVKTAAATTSALDTYTQSRAVGATRSTRFYADLSAVTPAGIKANTKQVTPSQNRVVTKYMAGRTIADFYGRDFKPGTHYYQLMKPEYLQDDKEIVVFIKGQGEYRLGSRAVRTLLGLPETGKVRIHPGPHSDKYEIFIQSSSVNRKVVEGQQMLTL